MRKISLIIGVLWLANFSLAHAADSLSYSGRLVNSNGSPVVGPVNLKAELAYTNASTVILCSDEIASVPLANGVFHIKLELDCTPSNLVTVLANTPANEAVAIRITDQSNAKVYSFQALHSIPFSLMSQMSKQIVQMSATEGQILTWDDTAKKWVPRNPVGTGNGSVTSINTGAGLIGGPISTSGTIAIDVEGVTSAMIKEGTIVDADISATAAIAQSKIANLGTDLGNKEDKLPAGGASTDYLDGAKAWQNFDQSVRGALLLGLGTGTAAPIADTNNVMEALENLQAQILSNDTAFDGTGQWSKTSDKIFYNTDNVGIGTNNPNEKLEVVGNIALSGKARFKDSGTNYVELKAPVTIGSTVTFTLPGSLGTNGQVLRTDASGNLSWVTLSTDSSGIVDGSIVDADIAAGANIAQSKIAGLSTSLTNLQNSITNLTTDDVAEGSINLYFTEPRVLGTDLAGLNTTAGAVSAADTILSSIGKLVGNIAAVSTAQSNYVLKAGDTMSGNLLMGGNFVTGLGAPLLDSDAATKKYVDDLNTASASKWTKNVNDIYYNTGNVGIGTSSPSAKLHVNSGSIEVSNYNVRKNRYGFHYDQGSDTTVYYHNLGRISNNDGDMHISGSMSGHDSLMQGKAIIDVFINARNAPYINGVVFGDPVNSNIEVYEDASGNLNVYLKTFTYSQTNLDIAVSGQATSYLSDSTKTSTVPTGTLVANVQDHAKLFVKNSGYVGIGTATPRSKLEVIGGIQIGADAVTCDATKAGTIRYNAGNVEYCNGGPSWQAFGVSGSGITTINGSTNGTQSFANGSTGTTPAWSTAAGVHTLNIPFASAAGVTAGLISKTDYDAFTAKLGTASTFSGDVSGTYNSTSVDKIKGTPVAITTITSGNFLKYNGTNWINSMLAAADIPNLDAAKITTGVLPVARGGTNTGSLTGNRIMVSTPTAIVEAAALTNGQILIGSTGAAPVPATLTAGSGVTINNSAGGISISATGTGGTVTNVTGTAPISVATGTTTPVVSISQANTTTNGYLSSTDWNIFNNKQPHLSAGATINGIVYPATALQTMQIPLAPVNLTDAVNKQYVDTQVASGANQWTLNGGNVYRASGNVGVGTTTPTNKLDVVGDVALSGKLRLKSDNANYVELKAPLGLGSTQTYTFPSSMGTSGYALTTNGAGTLAWSAVATTSTSVGGDLSGTIANAQLVSGAVGSAEIADLSIVGADIAGNTINYGKLNLVDGDIPQTKVNGLVTALSNKEPTITAGTTAQYWRGDKSWQTLNTTVVPEGTNLYFLDSRVRGALMSGYAAGAAIPLAATDTLLGALAKLEGQIIANKAAFDSTGQWSKNGASVYYNGGNVGIGTTSPVSLLNLSKSDATAYAPTSSVWQQDVMPTLKVHNTANSNLVGSQIILNNRTSTTEKSVRLVGLSTSSGSEFAIITGSTGAEDERLRVNALGNVGIGTSSPTQALHVSGNIISNQDYMTSVTFNDGWAAGDWKEIVQAHPASAAGSSHYEVHISSTRNSWVDGSTYIVGGAHAAVDVWREAAQTYETLYGTTKCFTLDFNGFSRYFRIRALKASASCGIAGTNIPVTFKIRSIGHNSSWTPLATSGTAATVTGFQSQGGSWNLYTGDPRFNPGNLAIHANSAGNVGMGTTFPRTKLDVSGEIVALNRVSLINDSTTTSPSWSIDQGGAADRFRIFRQPNLTTSGSEFITILNTGNVGIGTNAPAHTLAVNANIASGYTIISNKNSAAGGLEWRWYSSSTGAPLGANSMCFGLGACILSIYSSGNATLAGTLTQSSDVRLKRDISSIPNALDAVTKLAGVSYYWKDTNKDQSKQIGLIAQEVEKVFPELVETNAQGFKSVAYQNLVAPIINALGEIREWMFKTDERVQSLEKDNDELKRKNQELEQRLEKIENALNNKK